ncbi:MAG: helix-turn-helix domain-containing protein [Lachnospiraceae bacterium]
MTIKEMRELLGLSQQKFGDKYEIPRRTIQNWENGVNVPPDYVLQLLERCVREDAEK